MFKNLVQNTLRKVGYSLRSTKRFGEDYWADLATLSARRSSGRPVFFDVGAHHGETLHAARSYFPGALLYCFEPDPESYDILSASASGLDAVKLHAFALGSEKGIAKFHRNGDSMTNSLLPTSEESLRGAHSAMTSTRGVVEVPIETLDALCDRERIGRIQILKTDCQGYDLKVLQGAERMISGHKIDIITCEVIFDDEYDGQGKYHDLMAFLDTRGYQLIGFYNMARNQTQECTFCDAVFHLPSSIR
jgi:FkbM family methyltransferase